MGSWSSFRFVMKGALSVVTRKVFNSQKKNGMHAAHRKPHVLEAFKKAGWKVQFVPGNCTGVLQPLDLTVNAVLKKTLTDQFSDWCATSVANTMKGHSNMVAAVDAVWPDLRLSVLKPLHAKWIIDTFAYLATRPECITAGFEQAGITAAVNSHTPWFANTSICILWLFFVLFQWLHGLLV